MPLPLPNLDTRRWSDLVEEGVAIVPRYAPDWTDHNVHDPGITLVELLAWLVEHAMYRTNRVPDRHRLKFLALAGFPPRPPVPAHTVLGATLVAGTGTLELPAGAVFLALPPARPPVPFVLAAGMTLVEGALVALQAHDGKRFADRTLALRDHAPIYVFGAEPSQAESGPDGPALYLGFDAPWPAGPAGTDVGVHFRVEHGDAGGRRRLLDEIADHAADCARPERECAPSQDLLAVSIPSRGPHHRRGDAWCDAWPPGQDGAGVPPDASSSAAAASAGKALPPHHSVRLVWEYLTAAGWRELDPTAGEVADDTRSLTFKGLVRFRLPQAMAAAAVGAVSTPLHWVRCRVVGGRYDAAPRLSTVTFNALELTQSLPALGRFTVEAGVAASGPVAAGDRLALDVELDAAGAITSYGPAAAGAAAPELLVVDHRPATATDQGLAVLSARLLGAGTGLPDQHFQLEDSPVAEAELRVHGREAGVWHEWQARADLDASGPHGQQLTLDATGGAVTFGDGEHGRVPPAGAMLFGAWSVTRAGAGNVAVAERWRLAADDADPIAAAGTALNRALLGADPATLASAFERLGGVDAARGGADAESIGAAASRAAEMLWAHERLVELCPPDACDTLDQLDPVEVRARPAPHRAVTALDFERIALDVPGTYVHRARAWPGIDGRYACLDAPGTVTLVIVPELPRGRPAPTPGLVGAVRAYLDRRRLLCTRLVVIGPSYRAVGVRAGVRSRAGADAERVRGDVVRALIHFLDPLEGGPAGRGWPFGRDVYRSEILHVIDGVDGVDHALSLELSVACDDAGASDCGNICIGPTTLACSGRHHIEVIAG